MARYSPLADSGEIDGDPARIYDYGAAHPNLIRVEESIIDMGFVLYAVKPTIQLQTLEELRGTTWMVEYQRGVLLCENKLKAVVSEGHLDRISSGEQGLRKLLAIHQNRRSRQTGMTGHDRPEYPGESPRSFRDSGRTRAWH
jgi:hypothetical protein